MLLYDDIDWVISRAIKNAYTLKEEVCEDARIMLLQFLWNHKVGQDPVRSPPDAQTAPGLSHCSNY
jgi:hypothetical protein